MQPTDVIDRIDDVQVVDVREPDEWQAGHIDQADHIPMGEVERRLDEIDDDRAVVTVCRSGARSGEVAQDLRRRGYDAQNLEGGMEAWREQGLPMQSEDAGPARVA